MSDDRCTKIDSHCEREESGRARREIGRRPQRIEKTETGNGRRCGHTGHRWQIVGDRDGASGGRIPESKFVLILKKNHHRAHRHRHRTTIALFIVSARPPSLACTRVDLKGPGAADGSAGGVRATLFSRRRGVSIFDRTSRWTVSIGPDEPPRPQRPWISLCPRTRFTSRLACRD